MSFVLLHVASQFRWRLLREKWPLQTRGVCSCGGADRRFLKIYHRCSRLRMGPDFEVILGPGGGKNNSRWVGDAPHPTPPYYEQVWRRRRCRNVNTYSEMINTSATEGSSTLHAIDPGLWSCPKGWNHVADFDGLAEKTSEFKFPASYAGNDLGPGLFHQKGIIRY
jgi:hypothetical protein